jgi:hypothetical protein
MPARRRPLGAAVVTLIVVDAVLVLILAILLVQSGRGAVPAGGATASPGATAVAFASPSRNITCDVAADAATCRIADFTYPTPPVADCAGNPGHEVRLTADGATWVCHEGEPPAPAGEDVQVLAYGESVSASGFTCTSTEQGVTCRHDESGHSFSLARGGATLD